MSHTRQTPISQTPKRQAKLHATAVGGNAAPVQEFLEKVAAIVERPTGAVDVFVDSALTNPQMRKVLEAWAK